MIENAFSSGGTHLTKHRRADEIDAPKGEYIFDILRGFVIKERERFL